MLTKCFPCLNEATEVKSQGDKTGMPFFFLAWVKRTDFTCHFISGAIQLMVIVPSTTSFFFFNYYYSFFSIFFIASVLIF